MALYPSSNLTYVAAQSLAADYTAPQAVKEGYNTVFVQAVITAGGSPTGSLKIQVSADGTSWSDYTITGGAAIAVTANGVYNFCIGNLGSRFFRLAWVKTSGTGTLNAQYNLQ